MRGGKEKKEADRKRRKKKDHLNLKWKTEKYETSGRKGQRGTSEARLQH